MSDEAESVANVIRTDFSDDEKWQHICDLISAPQGGDGEEFYAYVEFISESENKDKNLSELVTSFPDSYQHMFCFVVDEECVTKPEHPLLVVGFEPEEYELLGRPPCETPISDIVTFRAIPSQIQGIENNLSLANMDYIEFAESVDDDGVFRGFPRL